ncbi:MAG: hypothetical protein EA348_00640 [Pseudomonadaceae bacterium]|nr:MAG: hypothetical protein EA348_00640 [Pseudomonadaceae bacterium]
MPILWGYSPADPAPYVIKQTDNNLARDSLTFRIGSLVAETFGSNVDFIATPNNRITEYLQQKRIELLCNTQPDWHDNPDAFLWTQPLYTDADVIVSLAPNTPRVLDDLNGKVLGTTLGYQYTGALTRAFENQLINRHDVRDISVRMTMVQRGRLDASIELRRAALYHLRRQDTKDLRLSDWTVEDFALRCAIAGQDQLRRSRLRDSINSLVAEGAIQRLVSSYD